AQVEGPGAISGPVRPDDGPGGPVRVEVDLLVEDVARPVNVVREPVCRAVVDAGVVGNALPVVVSELHNRVEFHGIQGVDLDRSVIEEGAALRVDHMGDAQIPGLDRNDVDVVRVRGGPVYDAERGIRPEPDEDV